MNAAAETIELSAATEREQAIESLNRLYEQQRSAYLADPIPNYEQRVADLKQLSQLLRDHQDSIVQAISDDFGNRAANETLFCEVYLVLEGIKDTIKHLKKWMKPEKRHINHMLYPGARNRLIPQPLGIVGVIVPWNFPLNLSFAPLTSIFAAGNRAIVKMSDRSSRLAELLCRVAPNYFPEEKLAFVEGKHSIGSTFSSLAFDHLIFTGSSNTGKAVMHAAAENLTPVTLELGGKSPAVIDPEFDTKTAAERIMFWKLLNAGQICTTVDYLFVHESKVDEFIEHAKTTTAKRYPDINSSDYTSIIDDVSYRRLESTLEDARNKGATIIPLAEPANGGEGQSAIRKLAPHILLNVNDDMTIMQRETFGPLLPIMSYREPKEVIDYINAHKRPLAFYPFSNNKALCDNYIERIMAGGTSINNCLLHVGQHDLPFGGVGNSGMGHYHGHEGFVTFSKMRPVFQQGFFDGLKPLMPPYSKMSMKILNLMIRMTK